MQVSIEKILAALDQITHAVPCRKQGGNEVHLTVKPGTLTIYKEYDGAFARKHLVVDSDESFTAVIDGERVRQYLKTFLVGQVKITQSGKDALLVKVGSTRIRVPFLAAEVVCQVLPSDNRFKVVANGKHLKERLKIATGCVPDNDIRYYLMSVLFTQVDSKLRFVSTGGHSLITVNTDIEVPTDWGDVMVPPSVVTAMLDAIEDEEETEVLILNGESKADPLGIGFKGTSFEMKARLVDGKYPSWERVIPNLTLGVSVDKTLFTKGVRRMGMANCLSGIATKGIEAVRIVFGTNRITVKVSSGEGDEVIQAENVGLEHDVELAFNPKLIADTLYTTPDANVTLFPNATESSNVLLLKGEHWLAVIMPMRV